MKQLLIFLAAATVAFQAFANDSADEKHVQVITADGDTITGYIRSDLTTGLKNLFSKTGSIIQYINIGEEPKGGKTTRFNASQVKEYRFLETSEAYPEGEVCVSVNINSPVPFKPGKCVRGFAWELDRRESGQVLQWNVYETTGGKNSVSRLVPAVGLKLKGANAAYIIIVNGRVADSMLRLYLKKKHPELKKAWEDYYHKGSDAKAHRKELLDNPSTALMFYERFIQTNEPVNDEND